LFFVTNKDEIASRPIRYQKNVTSKKNESQKIQNQSYSTYAWNPSYFPGKEAQKTNEPPIAQASSTVKETIRLTQQQQAAGDLISVVRRARRNKHVLRREQLLYFTHTTYTEKHTNWNLLRSGKKWPIERNWSPGIAAARVKFFSMTSVRRDWDHHVDGQYRHRRKIEIQSLSWWAILGDDDSRRNIYTLYLMSDWKSLVWSKTNHRKRDG